MRAFSDGDGGLRRMIARAGLFRVVWTCWLASIALAGCRPAPAPPPERVLLISIDTLRADHLGTYGYSRPTSPGLDAFGKQGVVFTDVTTPSPWTLPSHASMLTGLYPGRHALLSSRTRLADSVVTLAEHLGAHGFTTAAMVNSRYLSPALGLDRGFTHFRYLPEVMSQREPTRAITDQALAWVEELRGKQWFMFVHYYDVHSDYGALPEYEAQFVRPYTGAIDGSTAQLLRMREQRTQLADADVAHLVDLYDAGIRQMDDEVGRFLRAIGDDPGLLVIVTSDHGEELFDHGSLLHGRTQYQELVRVPLLMRGAGVPPGVRVAGTASLVDVMPTILQAVGVPAPAALDGIDLAQAWRGQAQALDARYLSCEADHNAEPDVRRAVRHRQHTLHFDRLAGSYALFDLSTDPHEHTDRVAAHPAVVAELRVELDRFRSARGEVGSPGSLTPEQMQRLRSLGYVR